MKCLIKNLLIVISVALFIGCSGEQIARTPFPVNPDPRLNARPVISQPVGKAKLTDSTYYVEKLQFDISGTQGRSPLHHSGSALFTGTIVFKNLKDQSSFSGHTTTSIGQCPTSGVPIPFQCEAQITGGRNFYGCRMQFSSGSAAGSFGSIGFGASPVVGALGSGAYTLSGSFFNAKEGHDKTYDVLGVDVRGPCTAHSFNPHF